MILIGKLIKLIKKIIKNFYNSPGHHLLLQHAILGNIHSQYNLANFYFNEKKNYIEAYAWAEVACYRNHPDAALIKTRALEKLSTNQIKEAWLLARNYKFNFC